MSIHPHRLFESIRTQLMLERGSGGAWAKASAQQQQEKQEQKPGHDRGPAPGSDADGAEARATIGLNHFALDLLLRRYFDTERRRAKPLDNANRETDKRIREWYLELLGGRFEAAPDIRLDEVFLISKASGYLIAHYRHADEVGGDAGAKRAPPRAIDGDLVAGMLTAIQAFIRECFELNENEQLSLLKMGGRNVMIEHSRHLFLAIVFTGTESPLLREEIGELLRVLEASHRDDLGEHMEHELVTKIQQVVQLFFSSPKIFGFRHDLATNWRSDRTAHRRRSFGRS